MANIKLPGMLTRKFNKFGYGIKVHSPEILIGAGIVGVITSTVMACKATTKLEAILEEPKAKIEKAHELLENKELVPEGHEYTEEDCKKDVAIICRQSAVEVIKLYAPSVALGTLSIAAILGGHRILKKRNVALAAAYATLDKCFKDYRGRVVDKFGKDIDNELRFNIKPKEVEKTIIDENGKEKTVIETVEEVDPLHNVSPYARFFDESCKDWTKDPEYNLMFLLNLERYFNERLESRGFVFLNEVYDALGIQLTHAGQIVGWIYDEECPNGDNKIDFNIHDYSDVAKRRFVNGIERVILLDFNVDGEIADKI